jgi:hypothetical protein
VDKETRNSIGTVCITAVAIFMIAGLALIGLRVYDTSVCSYELDLAAHPQFAASIADAYSGELKASAPANSTVLLWKMFEPMNLTLNSANGSGHFSGDLSVSGKFYGQTYCRDFEALMWAYANKKNK